MVVEVVIKDLLSFAPLKAKGSCPHVFVYKLIADFLTSPIDASGSLAPSFGAIHFFSLEIMSSSSFLSSAVGMYSFTCWS